MNHKFMHDTELGRLIHVFSSVPSTVTMARR